LRDLLTASATAPLNRSPCYSALEIVVTLLLFF